VEAGLDMAIVNPAHITPYAEIDEEQRRLADDLIYDRGEDALAKFIAFYESRGVETEEAADPTDAMEPEEALHWKILHRKKDGIGGWVDAAVQKEFRARTGAGAGVAASAAATGPVSVAAESVTAGGEPADAPGPDPLPHQHEAAVTVLNQTLLPAMKDVGDKFGAGELILPFVLQSAEVMKRAVAR